MAQGTLTLTEQTFDEVVGDCESLLLVDFWAEWCGPCKMIAPVLDQIAADHHDKLRVGKINIDDNLELAQRFKVMSIPTLILFKDGTPRLRIVGAKGKGELLEQLHPFL